MAFTSVREVFEGICQAEPDGLQDTDCVFLFTLTGMESSRWTLALQRGKLTADERETATPDVTITLESPDLIALANRELNPMAAFMQGRIKLSGNMALAMRLQNLFT